ncbi:hypothetical protein Ddc_08727 [Ditylenchus destructor]|nr:hypothetical protein Ddc_08727 [Ditylenchus destructor]
MKGAQSKAESVDCNDKKTCCLHGKQCSKGPEFRTKECNALTPNPSEQVMLRSSPSNVSTLGDSMSDSDSVKTMRHIRRSYALEKPHYSVSSLNTDVSE